MDANTVIAICSVVIAVASLGVSAYVALATRKHNQLSVQPVLGFGTMFRAGGTAGLRLVLQQHFVIVAWRGMPVS